MDDLPQDPSSTTPMSRPRATHTWLIILILVTTFAFLATKFGFPIINKPVEGTIISRSRPVRDDPVLANKQIKTAYYTAEYTPNYVQTKSPVHSASLDAQVLVAQQQDSIGTGSRITLTVTTMPGAGVVEDGAYKAFYAQPDLYTVSEDRRESDVLIIAKRTSPNYEQTILWPHAPYLLTITMVAATASTALDQEVQTIVESLKW